MLSEEKIEAMVPLNERDKMVWEKAHPGVINKLYQSTFQYPNVFWK
jgi:hypothetical protein